MNTREFLIVAGTMANFLVSMLGGILLFNGAPVLGVLTVLLGMGIGVLFWSKADKLQ